MKKRGFVQITVLVWMLNFSAFAQEPPTELSDSPETLQWVQRQSNRIDSMLVDAMRSSEPIEVFIRLTDCYQLFDAVAMSGLYCTNVRAAAEAGRKQCDVINYRLEKDLNAKLQRAVEARRWAVAMREGAKVCQNKLTPTTKVFLPMDLMLQDARLAELDLLDGMSSNDLHILSQKLEHAIRTLHDIEHLARSLNDCDQTMMLAQSAVLDCEQALAAPNWVEVIRSVKAALVHVQRIQQESSCK